MVRPYLKTKLGREFLVGTQIVLSDAMSAELIGRAGYDFAVVDVENGDEGIASLRARIKSLAATDTPTVARVSATNSEYDMRNLRQVLALGPDGLILTGINDAQGLRAAISECLLPPHGMRRVKPHMAVGRGGVIGGDYTIVDAGSTAIILQLDTAEALRNLDEILLVRGVDAFIFDIGFFCSADGHPQDIFGRDTELTLKCTTSYFREMMRPFGVSVCRSGRSAVKYWCDCGANFVVSGTDAEYILEGARRNLSEFGK